MLRTTRKHKGYQQGDAGPSIEPRYFVEFQLVSRGPWSRCASRIPSRSYSPRNHRGPQRLGPEGNTSPSISRDFYPMLHGTRSQSPCREIWPRCLHYRARAFLPCHSMGKVLEFFRKGNLEVGGLWHITSIRATKLRPWEHLECWAPDGLSAGGHREARRSVCIKRVNLFKAVRPSLQRKDYAM